MNSKRFRGLFYIIWSLPSKQLSFLIKHLSSIELGERKPYLRMYPIVNSRGLCIDRGEHKIAFIIAGPLESPAAILIG